MFLFCFRRKKSFRAKSVFGSLKHHRSRSKARTASFLKAHDKSEPTSDSRDSKITHTHYTLYMYFWYVFRAVSPNVGRICTGNFAGREIRYENRSGAIRSGVLISKHVFVKLNNVYFLHCVCAGRFSGLLLSVNLFARLRLGGKIARKEVGDKSFGFCV